MIFALQEAGISGLILGYVEAESLDAAISKTGLVEIEGSRVAYLESYDVALRHKRKGSQYTLTELKEIRSPRFFR